MGETMTKEAGVRTVPAWPKDRLVYRLERCRAMLNLHGMISPAENDRVQARLRKAFPHDPLYAPEGR